MNKGKEGSNIPRSRILPRGFFPRLTDRGPVIALLFHANEHLVGIIGGFPGGWDAARGGQSGLWSLALARGVMYRHLNLLGWGERLVSCVAAVGFFGVSFGGICFNGDTLLWSDGSVIVSFFGAGWT